MLLFISAVMLALCVSALCSLLEATLLSVTPPQIAQMHSMRPRAAAIWQRFKQNIEQPIAVILIVNTAAHTIGATVAGAQFELLFGDRWVIAFSLVLTYLMLQFTEILPKTVGVTHNRALAPLIARPLDWLVRLFTPLLRFIHWVNRPFERRTAGPAPQAIQEISAMASIARTAGAIDLQQARLIEAASRLPELRVRQIMTHRTSLVYLKIGQPLEEVLRTVQQIPYTRLPLCEGDVDHIIGMIHVRDLFNHLKLTPGKLKFIDEKGKHGEPVAVVDGLPGAATHVIGSGDIDLLKIMRRIIVVPELTPVPSLLRQFQESRIHMAAVVDEYGATLGVVTLEDIIEEMVGDIEDEFDAAPQDLIPGERGSYRAAGSRPLHELRDQIGLDVQDEQVDTLGGYIQKQLGRFPEKGDVVRIGQFEVVVLSIDRRRVGQVELRKLQLPDGDGPSAPSVGGAQS